MGLTVKMQILNKYKNGNCEVTIYEDGTKVREYPDDETPNPYFPETIDLKITNLCELNCPMCHEMSTINGNHSNPDWIIDKLKDLPNGVELAIGGGNPLAHPNLLDLLTTKKQIFNLTVNAHHLDLKPLRVALKNKLIYGLGISVPHDRNIVQKNIFAHLSTYHYKHAVIHLIAGIHTPELIGMICNTLGAKTKFLILGYKQIGRGAKFYNTAVESCISEWKNAIGNLIKKHHICFDNLALEQLNVKQHISKADWDSFYMGDDGTFSMYIDAVKQEFAVSSTSAIKFSCEDLSITEMFDFVKKQKNKSEKQLKILSEEIRLEKAGFAPISEENKQLAMDILDFEK